MKVSSVHEVNLPTDIEEVELLQQGGRMKLLDVAEMKKKSGAVPSKTDNTKVKGVLKAKPGQTDYYRDQGTISAYNKSPRERLISSMHKLANVGDGAITGLIAQPVLSGARLLRADKYFDGVDSDAKLGSALGSMAMDALTVLPAAKPLRALGVEAKGLARATGDAFGDTFAAARDTYKTTADIANPIKRVENAILSGAASKGRKGDILEHNYFHMEPDEVSKIMATEKLNAPKGAVLGDYNMSANSSPLYWNQTARDAGGAKLFKTVRPGYGQEVNSSGVLGKRVAAAFPEDTRWLHQKFVDEAVGTKEYLKQSFTDGKITKEMYDASLANVDPNRRLFREVMSDKANFGYAKEWYQNYKPTMDKGIQLVNKETGLNFPMTDIKGLKSGNPEKLKYVQPTAVSIKGGHARTWQTLKSNMADIPRHYQLNKMAAADPSNRNISMLKGRIVGDHMEGSKFRDNVNYIKKEQERVKGWVDDFGVPPPPVEVNAIY